MAKVGTTTAYDSKSNVSLNTQRASGMLEVGDTSSLAVTTTNVNVFSNGMKVGFIQSISPSESRTITKIQSLGVEGVVQSVPGNTQGGQLSLSRFTVYNSNMFNALGMTRTGQFVQAAGVDTTNSSAKDATYGTFANPFKTLKDQRVPIEIQVKTTQPDGAIVTETYIDCWLASYSKTIASNAITITESATAQYSDVL